MSNWSFSALVWSVSKSKPETVELTLFCFPPKFSQGLNIYSLQFKAANGNIVSFPTDGALTAKSTDIPSSPQVTLLFNCLVPFSHRDAIKTFCHFSLAASKQG